MSVEKVTVGVGQDSVASMVQVLLRKNSVLAQLVSDKSMYATPGDESVSFPFAPKGFVVQYLEGVEKGDDQEIVYEMDKIDLNKNAHVQWVVRKFDQAKSKIDILTNAIQEATIAHAEALDLSIYSSILQSKISTDITGGVTQDNIVNSITALNKKYAPKVRRSWVGGVDAYGSLLKVPGFVDAASSNLDIVKTGQIGSLYGYPVFMSDVMTSTEFWLIQENCAAYAFGFTESVESEPAIAYGTGSKRWVMDQLYGCRALQVGNMAQRIIP